jgi:ATP-binding cassette subfamily C protein CydC
VKRAETLAAGFGAGQKGVLRAAFFCALLAGAASILLLALSGWFLTAAAVAGAGGAAAVLAFNYLLPSAAIRALAILRTGGRYGERLLAHRAALQSMALLRGCLFQKLAAQDSRHTPDLSGGDASARLIGDIDALEDLIVRRPARPASVISAVLAVGLCLFAGWRAALVLAIMLSALPFLLAIAARAVTAGPARAAAQALGDLRTDFVEFAAARPEILSYGLADRVIAALSCHAVRVERARAALFCGEGAIAALMAAYGALTTAMVLAFAQGGAAQVALALLAAAAASGEAMVAFARTALRQAGVAESLLRLADLFDLPGRSAQPVAGPAQTSGKEQAPGEKRAVPLMLGAHELARGARVAIMGPSGSGKTRLVEALAGMRPAAHMARIDGVACADCNDEVLRGQFALSPQDATLIAGTIADNLRLARAGITETQMRAALAVACLDERVAAMPQGLETRIGEDGGTLSGGERKRLSLARALLARRPWLILDEPTEGLDVLTETTLIRRLGQWLEQHATGLILVSHRPAPLALAEQRIDIGEIKRVALLP